MIDTELVVTNFDGEGAASAAYTSLQRLERDGDIAILDAATLVKHHDGTSEIRDSQNVDAQHGAYFGAISGALIGLLGGPAGALIGSVAGATTGATAASLIDLGFPKENLQALDDQLAPGNSALVVLVESTWHDKLDTTLDSFDGQCTRRSLHTGHTGQLATAVFWQEVAKLRLEDARVWTALLAEFDADLARMDTQIGQESQLIRAELATLREQRDAKRQELEQKIQSRIDHLRTTIAHGRAELADSATEARAKIVAQITILETTINMAWQQLEISWHTQQVEWQHDLQVMQARAAQSTVAVKASVDAQIAVLEIKRQAAQQEWGRRKRAAVAAAQDLSVGVREARADLRQARANAAIEFK